MPGIFVVKEDGKLVEMGEQPYETEDVLQGLLEDYPGLLTGESGTEGGGRKYVLVRREAGVPEAEGATDRWSLDHLFLDHEGIPTLVEVKRSSDTRIRREVVGQMFDYAANIIAHWPIERMRSEFEARCSESDMDPETAIREVSEDDYEDYWQRVKTNIEARRLRLVFLADEIPQTLQTVVEFLNEQMRSTEVLAVEVKRHSGEGMSTLVSRVIGRTATARQTKAAGPKRDWDEESVLEEIRANKGGACVAAARQILDWAKESDVTIKWRGGPREGSAECQIAQDGAVYGPFGIDSVGRFWLSITGQVAKLRPFNDRERRVEFLARLDAIPGVDVSPEYADRSWRGLSMEGFDPEVSKQLLEALNWFLAESRNP